MYIIIVGRPKIVLFGAILLVMAMSIAIVQQKSMLALVVYELQVHGIIHTPK